MQGVGINSLLARIIFLQNFCTFRCFQKALNEAKPRKGMNTYIYLNLPNKPCGLKNHTFCSPEHFASWEQFASKCQLTFPLNTLYSLTHFAPQHTLLFITPCSLEHFATWNTLLHETLYLRICPDRETTKPGNFYSQNIV